MYEIRCNNCGRVGYHPSRTGAEVHAQSHFEETGHVGSIREVNRPLTDPS